MKQSRKYTFTLAAGGAFNLLVQGAYFRVQSCTGNVSVKADNGAFMLESIGVGEGISSTPYGSLLITDVSGAPNTVTILISDKDYVAALSGNVGIVSNKVAQSSAFAHTTPALTVGSTQILAANAARQYLSIQNNTTGANAYVSLDGAAATVARGLKVAPGGAIELASVVPVGAITWIGDVAVGAGGGLVVVEG